MIYSYTIYVCVYIYIYIYVYTHIYTVTVHIISVGRRASVADSRAVAERRFSEQLSIAYMHESMGTNGIRQLKITTYIGRQCLML